MKRMKAISFGIIAVCIAAGLFFWSRGKMSQAAPQTDMPSMPVPVITPVVQEVTNYNEFTGNLMAVESVDIRARVPGFLRRVAFVDGAFVTKGDLLFEIEPESYQADRDRAAAALQSARADLLRAEQDYERVRQAVMSDAVSKQDVSVYKAQRDMAEAAVLSAGAALDQAELNLSYTTIESPLDGRISRNYVDEGNLVGAGEHTVLANIVKLDPLYVYFYVSESEYLNYKRSVREEMAAEPNQLPLDIRLANKDAYDHQGRLDYMDNKVDPATGTLQIRGQIPNPEKMLYPGMFVQIRVPVETVRNAVLIPEKAIMTDLGGKFVLVADKENILQRRDIIPGATFGKLRVVKDGLSGDERVAVGGFAMIRPGMPITPMPGDGPPAGPASGQPGRAGQGEAAPSSNEQGSNEPLPVRGE